MPLDLILAVAGLVAFGIALRTFLPTRRPIVDSDTAGVVIVVALFAAFLAGAVVQIVSAEKPTLRVEIVGPSAPVTPATSAPPVPFTEEP